MESSRRGEVCKIDVHGASYVKPLRRKTHSENIRQDDINIPEWLFKEEQRPVEKKMKKIHNPKTLKQIARQNFEMNYKN